jgi:superfamily II DNA/RNA helicase
MYQHNPNRSGSGHSRGGARTGGYRQGGYQHSSRPSFGNRGGYNSRPSFGNRGGGGGRGGGKGFQEMRVDLSKLINKAVITEEVEHFVPEHKFSDFAVDERLKDNIAKKGYNLPTPIQDRSIPHILRGEDIVGIANTGTGKTAAFLIPLIDKVLKSRVGGGKSDRVLIMVPTRELALQIDAEFLGFSKGLGLASVCCVGGANIQPQIRVLRRDPAFVIGTPGRLKDLMERRELELQHFGTVVLDEADRMLDMGFITDMRFIMAKMLKNRHTLFFSATLSSEIERLIGEFLKEPARISVKTRDTSKNIDQDVVRVEGGKSKIDVLHELVAQPEFEKVLVFGRTKHGVEKLMEELNRRGFRSVSIHGNKTHGNRQRALADFKSGKAQIMVATDVAARGLDIPDVSHVINYDLPGTYEDYVHRIGRTGRASKKGKALTFIGGGRY